jgi:methyl-accepting chemotaxis protein
MAEANKLGKVAEIVKAMSAEGMPIIDIKDSLKQIGLKDDEIAGILQTASAEPTARDIHEAVKDVGQKIGDPLIKTVEEHKEMTAEVRDKVDDLSAGFEEHAQSLENISSNLDEHREKLDAIHSSIQELGESHKDLHDAVKDLSSFSGEFAELREIMLDIKANLAALKDLNNKILETNKEMLMRLKTK